MTDLGDRLAEIKEDLAPEELDWLEQHYKGIKDQVLWLVGEVERLREEGASLRLGFQRRNLELFEEIERLRDRLREIEWSGDGTPPEFMPVCPACRGHRGHGHRRDCWLATAIRTN